MIIPWKATLIGILGLCLLIGSIIDDPGMGYAAWIMLASAPIVAALELMEEHDKRTYK